MDSEQLAAAAETVVQLGDYLQELKSQTLAIFNPEPIVSRGYITPGEELQVRQLQLSYWKTRNALFELTWDIWRDIERIDRATPQQFLIALSAAALLVDAARFLRETFHRVDIVRRKLDEPDPVYGIPPRMYDDVQKSLTSPYHAWHLWQATRYYDRHRRELVVAAEAHRLMPLMAIIDRMRDRLRPSLWQYLRIRTRVRGRRAMRHIGRDVIQQGVYLLQTAVGCGMAEVFVKPGHMPSLPRTIRQQLVGLLRPGDVLVVRKEFAATNYFLPGYWPHAALYVGRAGEVVACGIAEHEHVRPRIVQLRAMTPVTGVLAPNEAHAIIGGEEHPCVLESMKDGVKLRSVNSPFNSDSIVVLRPLLREDEIACAITQGFMHEGKGYDFDFDFGVSKRLVCTEVIYRAYDGIGGIRFDLKRHVGRFALSAGDLIEMALARQHFEVAAVFLPEKSSNVATGGEAVSSVDQIVKKRTR